jgi:hypothetical protein
MPISHSLPSPFPHEWIQKKNFFRDTSRSIHRKIQRHSCNFSFETLKQQKHTGFPSTNLPLINNSFMAVTQDGTPIFYLLKGALRFPFTKDPIPQVSEALSTLISRYPPPPPKKTDERHKGIFLHF